MSIPGTETVPAAVPETDTDTAAENRQTGTTKENRAAAHLGAAVDIGTTTLCASLIDLQTGENLDTRTSFNRQRRFGADVLSRLSWAQTHGTADLTACIRRDLRELLEALQQSPRAAQGRIEKVTLCGNTVMTHFLLGYPVYGLCEAPFTPYDTALVQGAQDGVSYTVFPCIAGFLGGDTAAGLFALTAEGDLWRETSGIAAGDGRRSGSSHLSLDVGGDDDAGRMLVDLGTNGELVLRTGRGLFAASVAAGPAFEGGHLSCGVPCVPGAVAHVRMAGRRCAVETIGRVPPVGLCGSGAIEALAALRQNGWVDAHGTLQDPWRTEGYPLAEGTRGSVRLTQEDIRQLQMAKGAIWAGFTLLCREAGLRDADVISVDLAGSFGSGLSAEAAVRIGLFPKGRTSSVQSVGNAALSGAVQWLRECRTPEGEAQALQRLDELINRVHPLSLADHPDFNDLYLSGMEMP